MTDEIPPTDPTPLKPFRFTDDALHRSRARKALQALGSPKTVSEKNEESPHSSPNDDPNPPELSPFFTVSPKELKDLDLMETDTLSGSRPTPVTLWKPEVKSGFKTSEGILAYVLISILTAGGTVGLDMARDGAEAQNTVLSIVGTVIASVCGFLMKQTQAKYADDRKALKLSAEKNK